MNWDANVQLKHMANTRQNQDTRDETRKRQGFREPRKGGDGWNARVGKYGKSGYDADRFVGVRARGRF